MNTPADLLLSGNMTWKPLGNLQSQLLICFFLKPDLEGSYEVTDFSCQSSVLLRSGTKYKADIIGLYSVLTAI